MSHTVLLVEDTQEIATLIQLSLDSLALDIHHAINGHIACEFLDEQLPDLILLDLNLPGRSGWEVLEHAKSLYDEHLLKVIVTTAADDPSNRLVGKLQYVDHYLTKPFDPSELIALVQNMLDL